MGIIGWIILGLIAGAIAKAIKPGRQGGGWIATLLLGIVGAILGGWIGSALFNVGINEFWSLSTWLLSTPTFPSVSLSKPSVRSGYKWLKKLTGRKRPPH